MSAWSAAPGDLVRMERDPSGARLPLFDLPEHLGLMSMRPERWAPAGAVLTVLAVVHAESGHERVLVLVPTGELGWCWGGYLTRA